MAGRYDFTIEQGASFSLAFVWQSAGEPVNVTGYSARLQARPRLGSETLLLDLATPGDELTVGDTDGTVTLELTDEDTQALDFGGVLAYYDLELESPAGVVKRLLKGRIALALEVTLEDAS